MFYLKIFCFLHKYDFVNLFTIEYMTNSFSCRHIKIKRTSIYSLTTRVNTFTNVWPIS